MYLELGAKDHEHDTLGVPSFLLDLISGESELPLVPIDKFCPQSTDVAKLEEKYDEAHSTLCDITHLKLLKSAPDAGLVNFNALSEADEDG